MHIFVFFVLFLLQFLETVCYQGFVEHVKYIFIVKHGLCGLAHSSRNLDATAAGQASVVLKHTLHTNAGIEGILSTSKIEHFLNMDIPLPTTY